MDRREFLKYGSGGVVSIAFGATGLSLRSEAQTVAQTPFELKLDIVRVRAEMVDHQIVSQWAFVEQGRDARVIADREHPFVPGRTIEVVEGRLVNITVTNKLGAPHGFAIPGALDRNGNPVAVTIPPNEYRVVSFTAGPPGTYMYQDHLSAVNRALGLHGAFIVLPAQLTMPYSAETTPDAARRLFADLGASGTCFNFIDCAGVTRVGESWNPSRDKMWMFSQIDPELNDLIIDDGVEMSVSDFRRRYLPRYFTLSGRSGFFAAEDKDTSPKGAVGQPVLLRCLNAGLAAHSPHIHGNHVYDVAARNDAGHLVVHDNISKVDTWTMRPGSITDVLLPFQVPPDIWPWPPRNCSLFSQQLPLFYAMHCHCEMSQTAAGGTYPQGLIAHWAITKV